MPVMNFLRRSPLAQPADHTSSRLSRDRQRIRVVLADDHIMPWDDTYHLLLTISWAGFLALTLGFYVGVNALFAFLYWLDLDGIATAQPGSFADAFFFSVQTLATIGYGAMHPVSTYTNMVAAAEALGGLLLFSVITGLVFARFSRPTAQVLFSRPVVIAPYNGVPTLMFRMANTRHNQILEAQVQVAFVRDELTGEGMQLRRFQNLELVRSQSPMFALTWTVMHAIVPGSPLYGLSLEQLAHSDTFLIVSLTGLDETLGQTIHARYIYTAADFQANAQFLDILSRTADGSVRIDYRHFHRVHPLEQATINPDRLTPVTVEERSP
jgi:inward rectifier potassium channel